MIQRFLSVPIYRDFFFSSLTGKESEPQRQKSICFSTCNLLFLPCWAALDQSELQDILGRRVRTTLGEAGGCMPSSSCGFPTSPLHGRERLYAPEFLFCPCGVLPGSLKKETKHRGSFCVYRNLYKGQCTQISSKHNCLVLT